MKNAKECPFVFKVAPEMWLYCMRDSQWCPHEYKRHSLFNYKNCMAYKRGVRSA